MKKLSRILLTFLLVFSIHGNALAATVYAPDGRRQTIPDSDVQSWVNVGWYTRPVTMVYAPDGSSSVIFSSDIQDAINNGWYTQPVTTVYAPDGTQSVIYSSDVDNAKSQGWYTYPVTTVYAPDGRSEIIPVSELKAWLNVGWYKDKATAQKYSYKDNIYVITNEADLSQASIRNARNKLRIPSNMPVDVYSGYWYWSGVGQYVIAIRFYRHNTKDMIAYCDCLDTDGTPLMQYMTY